MKRRIIQVIPQLSYGGAEVLVKNYVTELKRRGYDVKILCVKRLHSMLEKQINQQGVEIIYLEDIARIKRGRTDFVTRITNSFKWRVAVKRFFREESPDVVHSHMFTAEILRSASRELKKTKIFYTVHSDPEKYWGDKKNLRERNALIYLIKHNIFTLIGLHDEAKKKLHNIFGDKCIIEIVKNGVDIDSFGAPSISRDDVLRECNIPLDSYVIGHVGRFATPKNHNFLIDIFSEIQKKQKNSYMMLIGDGEKKQEIESLVEKYKINEYVRFLGNRSDLNNIYQCFDAFVFPSLWEGFPLSVIEAQAAKVRCFISDVISKEVVLSNIVESISLEKTPIEWANIILSSKHTQFIDKGLYKYSISSVVDELENLYFNGR